MLVVPAFVTHWEIIVVALIVLVLFGSRLPKVMRSLGSSLTEFKKGVAEGAREGDEEPAAESRIETKA